MTRRTDQTRRSFAVYGNMITAIEAECERRRNDPNHFEPTSFGHVGRDLIAWALKHSRGTG